MEHHRPATTGPLHSNSMHHLLRKAHRTATITLRRIREDINSPMAIPVGRDKKQIMSAC